MKAVCHLPVGQDPGWAARLARMHVLWPIVTHTSDLNAILNCRMVSSGPYVAQWKSAFLGQSLVPVLMFEFATLCYEGSRACCCLEPVWWRMIYDVLDLLPDSYAVRPPNCMHIPVLPCLLLQLVILLVTYSTIFYYILLYCIILIYSIILLFYYLFY